MLCPFCRSELHEKADYCPSCEAPIVQADGRLLTKTIQTGADGTHRWLHSVNLWRNTQWLRILAVCFGLCFGGFALLSGIVSLVQGEFYIWTVVAPLLVGVGLLLLSLVIWACYVLISGGRMWGMFTMDDRGVTCRWLDQMYALASGSSSKSKAWHVDFADVRTLVLNRKRSTIGLKGLVITPVVYTAPEDYETALAHIRARVPKDVKIKEK